MRPGGVDAEPVVLVDELHVGEQVRKPEQAGCASLGRRRVDGAGKFKPEAADQADIRRQHRPLRRRARRVGQGARPDVLEDGNGVGENVLPNCHIGLNSLRWRLCHRFKAPVGVR